MKGTQKAKDLNLENSWLIYVNSADTFFNNINHDNLLKLES